MKFNLKYLILPLSIMVCINHYNVNAIEDEDENPNKIIENNKGNNDISKINNQENNEFLQIKINNENDTKDIKKLITEKDTNIPTVKFLIKNTKANQKVNIEGKGTDILTRIKLSFSNKYNDYNNNYLHSIMYTIYNKYHPNDLSITPSYLKDIKYIVKALNFFAQKDEEYKKLGENHKYYFDFVISDNILGIGLSHDANSNYEYNKCIFIQPSNYYLFAIHKNYNIGRKYNPKYEINYQSFRRFLHAVKLCSTKKLQITFKDENGIEYNTPYLITKDEYKTFLTTLMKDFWKAFYGTYKYDILQGMSTTLQKISKTKEQIESEIKKESQEEEIELGEEILSGSEEEYEFLKNKYFVLNNKIHELEHPNNYSKKEELKHNKNYIEACKKRDEISYLLDCYNCKFIVNAFENDYNNSNFIKIFGLETIKNIRSIIYNLIDIEINNNEEFEKTLYDIIKNTKNLYSKLRYRLDEVLNEIIGEYSKKKLLEQKVWKNNIYWPEYNNGLDIFKGSKSKKEDQYKLHSKQRVESYLKKLFFDTALNKYLKETIFKYIMNSHILITKIREDAKDRSGKDMVNLLGKIKNPYIFDNIFKYPLKDNRMIKLRNLYFMSHETDKAKEQNNNDDNEGDNVA